MANEIDVLTMLTTIIMNQQKLINSIADKIEQIDFSGGGGGSASIEDYASGKEYTRNMLLVDPDTETVYRVLGTYTSVDVATDCASRNLKLVGYESQFIAFNHNPSQEEIDVLPEDSLVAVYSSTTNPYTPILSGDNMVEPNTPDSSTPPFASNEKYTINNHEAYSIENPDYHNNPETGTPVKN